MEAEPEKVVAERSLSKLRYTPMRPKIKKNYSLPPKMSMSLPTISMLDEEDAHICEHEITIERVKEEWQRQ